MRCLSRNVLLYTFNAFSIWTKHLCPMAMTFEVWGATVKQSRTSFSFSQLYGLKIHSYCRYEQPHHMIFFFLIKLRTLPFHLKGSALWLLSFFFSTKVTASLWLNWQYYNSFTLRPLLSKIRIAWTEALWYLDSRQISNTASSCLVAQSCLTLLQRDGL